jgi:hypothetical protein
MSRLPSGPATHDMSDWRMSTRLVLHLSGYRVNQELTFNVRDGNPATTKNGILLCEF